MEKECIFCKIVRGEIPSHKLYEDDKCVVILDKFPATKGQTLVITKEHKDYIFDLDNETYSHLFKIARKISKAIDKSLKPLRTCIVVEGFMVPHVHIRLHPSYETHISLEGKEASNEELEGVAKKLKMLI